MNEDFSGDGEAQPQTSSGQGQPSEAQEGSESPIGVEDQEEAETVQRSSQKQPDGQSHIQERSDKLGESQAQTTGSSGVKDPNAERPQTPNPNDDSQTPANQDAATEDDGPEQDDQATKLRQVRSGSDEPSLPILLPNQLTCQRRRNSLPNRSSSGSKGQPGNSPRSSVRLNRENSTSPRETRAGSRRNG